MHKCSIEARSSGRYEILKIASIEVKKVSKKAKELRGRRKEKIGEILSIFFSVYRWLGLAPTEIERLMFCVCKVNHLWSELLKYFPKKLLHSSYESFIRALKIPSRIFFLGEFMGNVDSDPKSVIEKNNNKQKGN